MILPDPFRIAGKTGAAAFPQRSHVAGRKKKKKKKRNILSRRERFKHEVGKLVAESSAADELITYFGKRFWRRWMLPLAIRIHTSLIHPATSHCCDPVTCSESPPSPPRSAASLPPPLFVLRLPSSRTGRQISCVVAQTRRENAGKYISAPTATSRLQEVLGDGALFCPRGTKGSASQALMWIVELCVRLSAAMTHKRRTEQTAEVRSQGTSA